MRGLTEKGGKFAYNIRGESIFEKCINIVNRERLDSPYEESTHLYADIPPSDVKKLSVVSGEDERKAEGIDVTPEL